jgi:hypothetical protein
MDLLIKILERLERLGSRVLGPLLRGTILSTAWVLRRGRYRSWRREQTRRAANGEPRGPGGSGWE